MNAIAIAVSALLGTRTAEKVTAAEATPCTHFVWFGTNFSNGRSGRARHGRSGERRGLAFGNEPALSNESSGPHASALRSHKRSLTGLKTRIQGGWLRNAKLRCCC